MSHPCTHSSSIDRFLHIEPPEVEEDAGRVLQVDLQYAAPWQQALSRRTCSLVDQVDGWRHPSGEPGGVGDDQRAAQAVPNGSNDLQARAAGHRDQRPQASPGSC